jgi:hypothetical protein
MDDDDCLIETILPDLTHMRLTDLLTSNDPELLAAMRALVDQICNQDPRTDCC